MGAKNKKCCDWEFFGSHPICKGSQTGSCQLFINPLLRLCDLNELLRNIFSAIELKAIKQKVTVATQTKASIMFCALDYILWNVVLNLPGCCCCLTAFWSCVRSDILTIFHITVYSPVTKLVQISKVVASLVSSWLVQLAMQVTPGSHWVQIFRKNS